MPIQEDLETPSPKAQGPESPKPDGGRRAKSARRSSSARTASSPTSARTSPTSSGSSGCSGATSTTASSRTGRTDRCGRRARRAASGDHPPFGGAAYVYNVIDVRQSYLQKLLKQALIAVGHPEGAERSHHFSYEMVALSHATARELGFAPAAGLRGREASVRRGVGPQGARRQGRRPARHADAQGRQRGRQAQPGAARRPNASASRAMIAIAAVRYFLIKFSRGKVIAFDLDEALSFEGESGPYIQYAVVRANNIFQKLQQRDGLDEAALLASLRDVPAGELTGEQRQPRALVAGARGRRGSTRSSSRSSARSSSRCSRSTRSRSRRRSTPSTIDSPDPQRGARRRAAVARGGGHLPAQPADARARPDGDRRPAGCSRRCDVTVHRVGTDSSSCRSHRRCTQAATTTRKSVRRAGGDAVGSLDIGGRLAGDVIGRVDGILLPGGGDVLPSLYGEAPHPDVRRRRARPRRLRDRAGPAARSTRDLPLLAICRGIQVLNVARGGTLVQDIPSEVPGTLEHKLAVPPHDAVDLRTTSGSRRTRCSRGSLGDDRQSSDTCAVNSRHHQAVKELGDGPGRRPRPRPTASSKPSRIRSRRFCLGVQWHPENFYRTGEFRALFEGFVEACRKNSVIDGMSAIGVIRAEHDVSDSLNDRDACPSCLVVRNNSSSISKDRDVSTCAVFGNRSIPVRPSSA